jgi:hypothetical protein
MKWLRKVRLSTKARIDALEALALDPDAPADERTAAITTLANMARR